MEKQKCPAVRFNGFSYEWQKKEFKEIFNYERPDNYIVKSTEYLDSKKTPVLTANKGFILGYTDEIETYNKPCIIFDDFTLDSKYVDFSFMVKSSALKILTVQDAEVDDLYYSYYLLKQAKIEIMGHARHYIGIVQPTKINVAFFKEQQEISNFFQKLDRSIALHEKKLVQTQNLKKAMLEKMFPKAGSMQPEIRLKGFSGDWEQQYIGDCTTVGSGARVHKEEWTSSGVPFYRSSDVVSSYKGNDNSKAYISFSLFEKLIQISGRLKKDDLLVTGGGSIGIPYLVPNNEPLYSKDADLIWIKKSAKFNSQYLYTFFSTSYFRNFIASISHIGTIAHYTIEQVKETPVCLPSIEEQVQIGQFFKHLDETLVLQQQQLQTLKNLEQAFLEKMFV